MIGEKALDRREVSSVEGNPKPLVVMETLGHSEISLTLNTYSHVMPSVGREAAERMDQLLGTGRP